MSDFGETTEMQNKIFRMVFRIMNSQNQQEHQNPMIPNPNQMGMQDIQGAEPMVNQNNKNNQINNQNNHQMGTRSPMAQNNRINNEEQNEKNINQGMNMGMGMGIRMGMGGMNSNPMMGNMNQMNLGMMGMPMWNMPITQRPDFSKIKQNLSKLYGDKMNFLVDVIYNDIRRKIMQLNNLKNQIPFNQVLPFFNKIKINFYGDIFEIKLPVLYVNLYISGFIEYIFDDIFGEITEEFIFGERKYEGQTTEEIIMKPRIEIKKIRINDYFRYLFLEYKGKDLKESKYKTCEQLGIDNNTELILKFKESESLNDIKEKIDENKIDIKDKNIENNKDNIINNNIINNNNIKIKKNISTKSHNFSNYYNTDNKPKLNVSFIKHSKTEIVQIEPDKSIKNLIDNYLYKIGEEPDFFLQRYIFLYNSNVLLKDKDEPCGKILSDLAKIDVNDIFSMDGGWGVLSPFDFVDVTSNKIKLKKVTYASDPSRTHRKVKRGLNIFGICQNKTCDVKGKEVICSIGLDIKGLCFNVNEERENIKCPNCKKRFKKKTCGFWRCEYQFVGLYYDNEKCEMIKYKSEPHESPKNDFEYFDPDENGSREWEELIIFVLPRQKIKYKK